MAGARAIDLSSTFNSEMPAQQTNICLNMIVRNETGVLGRCFASLKDFIDYYVIVDTGSIETMVTSPNAGTVMPT